MRFRRDRRGAALQVGAVLLLGFLVIALSLYQATVVPAQNERVEFRHSQQVQGDMVDLRNALQRAGSTAGVQPVTVDMGTTYPSRVFFVNPPPPGGLLRTGARDPVTFSNVRATDGETADFLNTSAGGPYRLATREVAYRPDYHVYRAAPTTSYQSGVLVNERADADDTALTGQVVVRGTDVYLVAVHGTLSQAQVRPYAVDPRSLSTATDPTPVESTAAGNVTVTVPSTLSADRWKTLLGDEYDPDDSSADHHVRRVTETSEGVRLELDGGRTYRLRTALVGVGTGASAPPPAYLARVDPTGGADVAVEVRDRFNNPVPNSRVAGELTVNVTSGSDVLARDSARVGEDGRATFGYADGAETGDVAEVTLFEDGTAPLDTGDGGNGTVTVEVTDETLGGGDGGAGNETGENPVNPSGGTVEYVGADRNGNSAADVRFRNTGSEPRRLVEARVAFYYANDNQRKAAAEWRIASNGTTHDVGGPGVNVGGGTPTFGTSGQTTLTFEFPSSVSGNQPVNVQDDFFIVTLTFEHDGNTETNDYFVGVQN